MVKAILANQKTVTRRIVKPQPDELLYFGRDATPYVKSVGVPDIPHAILKTPIKCPYGREGDHLWVRETWAKSLHNYLYAADCVVSEGPQGNTDDWDWSCGPNHWRPSIFMTRAASRITLEITGVRVERLQEISEEDAMAEGVQAVISGKCHGWTPHVLEYCILWDKINGPGSWDANPYVWAVGFKRI